MGRGKYGAALAAALAALGLAGCGSSAGDTTASKPALEGALIPFQPAPAFALRDQRGERVSLATLEGHVVLLTFLYSHCGAPCEVIAQQIRGALAELPAGAADAVIISAHPRTDTPASIAGFLRRTGLTGRAYYLTGTSRELRPLYSAYRVHPPSEGRKRFEEYAFVMVITPEGRERALFEEEELTPEALALDVRRLGG